MPLSSIGRRRVGFAKLGAVVIGLMVGMTWCVASPARAEEVITSHVDMMPPKKQFTGDEWRTISLSSRRILKHVDDALGHQKHDAATADVEKALRLVKLPDSVLPASEREHRDQGGRADLSGRGQCQTVRLSRFTRNTTR